MCYQRCHGGSFGCHSYLIVVVRFVFVRPYVEIKSCCVSVHSGSFGGPQDASIRLENIYDSQSEILDASVNPQGSPRPLLKRRSSRVMLPPPAHAQAGDAHITSRSQSWLLPAPMLGITGSTPRTARQSGDDEDFWGDDDGARVRDNNYGDVPPLAVENASVSTSSRLRKQADDDFAGFETVVSDDSGFRSYYTAAGHEDTADGTQTLSAEFNDPHRGNMRHMEELSFGVTEVGDNNQQSKCVCTYLSTHLLRSINQPTARSKLRTYVLAYLPDDCVAAPLR